MNHLSEQPTSEQPGSEQPVSEQPGSGHAHPKPPARQLLVRADGCGGRAVSYWSAAALALTVAACAPATVGLDVVGRDAVAPRTAPLVRVPAGALAPAVGVQTLQAPPTPPGLQAQSTRRPGQAAVSSPTVGPKVALRTDAAMTAPLEATFTASLPGDGSADWQLTEWQFADGVSASGASVTHTFYQPGHYNVQARMKVGGHEYLATLPLDVRSGGPEQAAAVLLQDAGSVALSAQGSVVYAPYTPSFALDSQAATPIRQPLRAGTHRVQVSINAQTGVFSRTYSFRSQGALSAGEASVQQAYEQEVLRLTNQARAEGWNCQRQAYGGDGLPPLRANPELLVAARAQSLGMALNGYFDHRSAVDNSLPDARIRASGYRPVSDAENIAAGQPTPAAVVTAWMKSPGHCPQIMGDYEDIGVAYIHQDGSPYGDYWTQVFGKKRRG